MTDQKRSYRKKQRAESEAGTRRRITESTLALHETLGPAHTSISAIAERAGVRRSTVYRHFPDEASLFGACTAHWTALNPPPDVAGWALIEDPDERLRSGVAQLYDYYRRTERMMANLNRDEAAMPTVRSLFAGFRDYLSFARRSLMAGRTERGQAQRRSSAAIGHALSFATWRSLTREQGLEQREAVDLMCGLVGAACNL
jgi:AcrR family transcriptional regulator